MHLRSTRAHARNLRQQMRVPCFKTIFFVVEMMGLMQQQDRVKMWKFPKGNDPGMVVSDLKKLEGKNAAATLAAKHASYKFLGYDLSSITPKEIHFSIISSEDRRVMCSVLLAILVVLYHVNLRRNVVKPKSLVVYWPLCVVLLTDVFKVGTTLAPYAQRRKEDKESEVGKVEISIYWK